MKLTSAPLSIISEILPVARRRRVAVLGFGYGLTTEHSRLGTMVIGVAVLLDTGERVFVAPDHVRVLPADPTSTVDNVVPFVPRPRHGLKVLA